MGTIELLVVLLSTATIAFVAYRLREAEIFIANVQKENKHLNEEVCEAKDSITKLQKDNKNLNELLREAKDSIARVQKENKNLNEEVFEAKDSITKLQKDNKNIKEEVKQLLLEKRSCPYGFQKFRDNCYFFSTDTQTWNNAEISCQALGGHLVHITDVIEYSWIRKQLQGSKKSIWIGCSDTKEEGIFRWTDDNSKVVYSDWAGSQPDNYKGSEDCGMMWSFVNYQWNDGHCSHLFHYVCKI